MKKFSLKGNKVYFDEIFCIDLNKTTITEFDLKNKEYLTNEEYEHLIRLRALSMCYFLLSKQDYSIKELKTKLLLKYREKHIIDEIIEEFRETIIMERKKWNLCFFKKEFLKIL